MIHIVKAGETLYQISRDYRTSYTSILLANPGINPNQIYPGQSIVIPGLPSPETIPFQIDVSINTKRIRLLKNGVLQKQYPIAVGRMLHQTPLGRFVIVNRQPNPGGPFGAMWLSLSREHYGIHGTNDPNSIGKSVSRGCIRMHNRDVLELSSIVPNGTLVTIHP